MSRSIFFAMLALSPLGCASAAVMAPNESPNSATYTLTFKGAWTAASHPLDYPKGGLLSRPHFSGLIGATHNQGFAIIRDGQQPSRGLERLSEEGKHAPLDAEITRAIEAGAAGALFETDGVDPDGTARATFKADENHPMVSVVAMIAPSPDWFAGVGDVLLWEGDEWVAKREIDVFAWDSGGDDGTSYEASDADTNPKKATMLNASAHFVRDGAPVRVGTLVIERR